VAPATFGIFDHIEDLPGTPTSQLFRDRLDLVKMADEAGFVGFHLAEHHGTDLCMSPNQDAFIGAASQVSTKIRLGPLVKLLPLHHPVRIIEDMCVLDQLTEGRLDFGVGRGVVPIEHYWFGGNWQESRDRFTDTLGIVCDALATGEISSANSAFHEFPTVPLLTKPRQDPIPFWYPGNPVTAGRHGMNLMWPAPIDQAGYDTYVEAWHEHKGERIRFDGPQGKPRVGCVLLIALAETERQAREIARRGVDGLTRRTLDNHRFDNLVLVPDELDAVLAPLRRNVLAYTEEAVTTGAGTPDQIAERLAAVLEQGLTDYIVLQLPVGDMTIDEARRTLELFAAEVKPQLEKAALAA
jgi:alkanesulfonate monooxygenase SsuD/methylene tetrahydromethanopterin reductase-like flavin-dependent oxidoreductase (luciferase family)